jgi:hypothetical protein
MFDLMLCSTMRWMLTRNVTSPATLHTKAALEPVPKLVGALKVADTLQVSIHKLALHRNNLDGGGQRTADLNLAPPESPK